MTDRPILFSGAMVRALLAGTKTQTRRVVKPQPHSAVHQDCESGEWGQLWYSLDERHDPTIEHWKPLRCPHGVPGDRLWVKETWKPHSTFAHLKPSEVPDSKIFYAADQAYAPSNTKWWPSLFMQRRFSRLTLEVTEVRVERLQDISDEDAEAEGCPPCPVCHDVGWINSGPDGGWQCAAPGCGDSHRDQYRRLWGSINGEAGPSSWDASPWVWAISFKRVTL